VRTTAAHDVTTGRSKPRWVGGFATEHAAKVARDEVGVLREQAAGVADVFARVVEGP
jgi:hypothetical protein